MAVSPEKEEGDAPPWDGVGSRRRFCRIRGATISWARQLPGIFLIVD